jgi:hypothetical protein
MDDPNLEMLAAAARVLRPLLGELVFLGGGTTGLMISDPAAAGVHPTKDVDAITEIASYVEYGALSERLRGLGLRENASLGAPMCRWRYQHLIIDVMPTDDRVLGFGNRWYRPAISLARHVNLADLRPCHHAGLFPRDETRGLPRARPERHHWQPRPRRYRRRDRWT